MPFTEKKVDPTAAAPADWSTTWYTVMTVSCLSPLPSKVWLLHRPSPEGSLSLRELRRSCTYGCSYHAACLKRGCFGQEGNLVLGRGQFEGAMLLAASLLKFGGDRQEMPVEFRLRHSIHVNRKFRETLVYICGIFARFAVPS